MITTITYLSEFKASQSKPNGQTAMISIADPGHEPPGISKEGWGLFYQDLFIDGEYDTSTIEIFGHEFLKIFAGYMNEHQAVQIKEFIKLVLIKPNIRHVIVHCTAGRSRSVAIAQYISDLTGITATGDYGMKDMNHLVYDLLHNPSKFRNELKFLNDSKKESTSLSKYQEIAERLLFRQTR